MPTGSSHVSFTMAGLTAVGGLVGFARRASMMSLVAGLAIGGLYAYGGYLIQARLRCGVGGMHRALIVHGVRSVCAAIGSIAEDCAAQRSSSPSTCRTGGIAAVTRCRCWPRPPCWAPWVLGSSRPERSSRPACSAWPPQARPTTSTSKRRSGLGSNQELWS